MTKKFEEYKEYLTHGEYFQSNRAMSEVLRVADETRSGQIYLFPEGTNTVPEKDWEDMYNFTLELSEHDVLVLPAPVTTFQLSATVQGRKSTCFITLTYAGHGSTDPKDKIIMLHITRMLPNELS